MRLLICGGRTYDDHVYARMVLGKLHAEQPITIVVHGGASGADALGGWWARENGVEEQAL